VEQVFNLLVRQVKNLLHDKTLVLQKCTQSNPGL